MIDKRVKQFADILIEETEYLILPTVGINELFCIFKRFSKILTENEKGGTYNGIYPFVLDVDVVHGFCSINYKDFLKVLGKEDELENLKEYIESRKDTFYKQKD